jgi:hypothetical protein
MSPIQGRAGALDASMDNPYIRAYRRVPGEAVFGTESLSHLVWVAPLFETILFFESNTGHQDNKRLP